MKLVLLENPPGKGGTLNHLGVEVESSDTVHARSLDSRVKGCSPKRR